MKLEQHQKDYLAGYAMAVQEMMYMLTGDNTCAKSYDPIDFDENTIHSYAFNLKDGGRHHTLSDYISVEEITNLMLKEGVQWIKENNQNK